MLGQNLTGSRTWQRETLALCPFCCPKEVGVDILEILQASTAYENLAIATTENSPTNNFRHHLTSIRLPAT